MKIADIHGSPSVHGCTADSRSNLVLQDLASTWMSLPSELDGAPHGRWRGGQNSFTIALVLKLLFFSPRHANLTQFFTHAQKQTCLC